MPTFGTKPELERRRFPGGTWLGIPPNWSAIHRWRRRPAGLARIPEWPGPRTRRQEQHSWPLPSRSRLDRRLLLEYRGIPRNAIWSGVNWIVPKGSPTAVVSKGVSPKLPLADAGKSRLVPSRNLIRKVVISFVLLDRTTECRAGLYARVGGIRDRAEGVHGLKVPVAQKAEHVAVKIIRSRASDDVYHAA